MPPRKPEAQRQKDLAFDALVGQRARDAIHKAKLSPSAVADDLKISRSMMSLYLAGKRRMSTATVLAIAKKLGVPTSAILPGEQTSQRGEARPPSQQSEDLPDGLEHYLEGREDRLSPAVVRKMKNTHFQDTEGVIFDDGFWDEQRQLWEKRLGLQPLAQARGGAGPDVRPGGSGGASSAVAPKKV